MISKLTTVAACAVKLVIAFACVPETPQTSGAEQERLPVIPGAAGFGIETPAGSGRHLSPIHTNIVRVTNLDDSGPGSLRDALENQPSPKVIIFEVSGNIELQRGIDIGGSSGKDGETKGSYITIAGQMAPSPGITLMHCGIEINADCHDILMQHIRIRTGDTTVGGVLRDGWTAVDRERGVFSHRLNWKPNVGWGSKVGVMWNGSPLKESKDLEPNTWKWSQNALFVNVGQDPARGQLVWLPSKTGISDPLELEGSYNREKGQSPPCRVVVDHCSFSWGGDMNVKTNGNNTTFTNNISSEALHHPRHPKGPHSKGFLVEANNGPDTSHNTFFARNLLAHNVDRNPRHANNEMVIANNLIYDVRFGPQIEDGRSKTGPLTSTVVGNYIIETKSTRYAMGIFFGWKPESRIYIGPDNFYGGKVQTDPWNSGATTSFVKQKRFGAKYADMDVPLVNRVDSPPVWVDGYQVLTAAQTLDYVLTHAGARPADRDPVDRRVVDQVCFDTKQAGGIIVSQDDVGGWPDLAQNRRKLTPPKEPNSDDDGDGYTNLEEWLHGLAAEVERP